MATEDFKRKLTAILSADVKGYSRLMGEDEEATVRTITAHRKVITSVIHKYRGRVVDSPGDNILAEFVSVVDAVQSGVEIQEVIRAKNAELPDERRMEFRIGINLGDVIQEGERIYGDGVNIAARVEGLAEPGGICISGSAYEQIENKLALGYDYIGEHTVKNIVKPIRVYRVPTGPETLQKITEEKRPAPTWQRAALQRAALAVVIALVVVAGGVAIWKSYRPSPPPMEVASVEKMAYPLPDKPSIAVLPFNNLSGDPEQEYFSDGITEQIITGLSKISSLFVVARNSTFTYKGKPVKVQQVSEELGVRYVLEGSVQKSGERVRINAQLIDAIKGNHLWSETYDRELKDIFAVQDDITQKILTGLQVELTRGEQARVYARGTNNLKAYLKYLQAYEKWIQMNKESNPLARQLAEEAIALDPDYAVPYLILAATHMMDVFLGSSKSPKDSINQAMELNKKALALDDSLAVAHSQLGLLYTMTRQHDKGVAEAERGVELNPNSSVAHDLLGMTLDYAGRPEEAIPMFKKAIRLAPFAPAKFYYHLGRAYLFTGQCEEAISACEEAVRRGSNTPAAHRIATAAYSICGREEEARTAAAEVLRLNPNFSCDHYAKREPFKNQADIDLIIGALRKAGLP
jgi:adenylate cyclase